MPTTILSIVQSQGILLALVFLGIIVYVEAVAATGDNSAVSADPTADQGGERLEVEDPPRGARSSSTSFVEGAGR